MSKCLPHHPRPHVVFIHTPILWLYVLSIYHSLRKSPTGLLFLEVTFCLRTFACAVSSQTTFLWYLWITPFLLQIFAKDFCHLLCYLDRLLQISSHWFSLPTFTQYYFFLNTHCFLSHYRIYLHIIFYLSLSFRI